MKQRSKRARSMAAKIRSMVKKLLKESSGERTLTELQMAMEQVWNMRLRSDCLRSSLGVRDSGFKIHLDADPITVSLKNNTKRKEVKKVRRPKKIRKEVKRITKEKTERAKSKSQQQLSPEEFTLLAIPKLSDPPHKSIHSVFSGFNAAFRKYFPGLDPVKETQKLAKTGTVSLRPAKGGCLIFPGNKGKFSGAEEALKKMGLK